MEKPGDHIGRYKLREKIGEGGCGAVYVAEQEQPVLRHVALKVIKLGMDTRSVIARFEAERQALAVMDHPNIAKVFDAGSTETGRPFFVMELVRGLRITEYCDQNKLPTRQRLDLFIKVCQAVQHAHQKGIIHRDLKPSNIMVTLHDGVPVPKVIDFGIAKATEGRLTDLTVYTELYQFIGTPAYMSPEQVEMSGLDIDTRSDIYSLGVLLYEMLTGCTPFDAEELLASGLEAMRRTIREKDPLWPSTRLKAMLAEEQTTTAQRRGMEAPKLVHLLRGDLDWIVMRCLEKDRTRRYETANGLAADLTRFLVNEPVLARPPSQLYRFQKLVRRNRVVTAAACMVLLALSLGFGATTWQAARAMRANRESRHLLYVANMNLAQAAWDENGTERVRQLLNETATNRERGFEWYYWQRQMHRELETFRMDTPGNSGMTFSPDGQRIVSSCRDNTAKVCDLASRKEMFTLVGPNVYILVLAFSPDGHRIITAYDDPEADKKGTAIIWDATSGKKLLTLSAAHHFRTAAFSPDSRLIVAGFWPNTAEVLETASGKRLLTLEGHRDHITCVAFSADGRRIITGGQDGTAKIWDAIGGKDLLTIEWHGAGLTFVGFSPDGRRILIGNGDGTLKVWDAANGKDLFTLKGHNTTICSAVFSPDGRRILTGSGDGTARVWNAVSGQELFALKGHRAGVSSAVFSPSGQRILTGSGDGTVKVWEAGLGSEPLPLLGHRECIYGVAFSPDGQRIVTGSGGWDLWHGDTAIVWDVASGKALLSLKGLTNWVMSVAFSPDGRQIATGGQDGTVKVWDAGSGQEQVRLKGHTNYVHSVVFSRDGRRILTGSGDRTAKVWEVASGRELLTLNGHGDRIDGVAFSPDNRRIVTGSEDRTARVWEVASGKELKTLKGHNGGIDAVAFSPDGQRIVTGSDDSTAKVWDVASGRELVTLKGHSSEIDAVTFSPDGQRIVTGSDDRTAKVWDAASGRELLTLKGHSDRIASVAFSPDGLRIVTGSGDGTAKIWQAATPQQVATWQNEEK
jgi:WD40 repeat protein/serine/threonine protein kinase